MNVANAVKHVQKVLDFVDAVTPIVGSIGGSTVDNLVNIIRAASSIAGNILERYNEGAAVLSTKDAAKLRTALAALQERNDRLAQQVAAS